MAGDVAGAFEPVGRHNFEDGPFVSSWRGYHAAGLAVLPSLDGKQASIRWATMKVRPGARFLGKLALQFPAANVAILTGRRSRLTVVDVDSSDPDDLAGAIERFGYTLIIVQTPSGGWHLWYQFAGERTTTGLDGQRIDVRAEGGLVMAPPSWSAKRREAYRFIRGSLTDIARLPPAKAGSLPLHKSYAQEPARMASDGGTGSGGGIATPGSRDRVLAPKIRLAAATAPSIDALRSVSRRLNAEHCSPPLSEAEVEAKVRKTWDYKIKGTLRPPGTPPYLQMTRVEFDYLADDPYALYLSHHLRFAHQAVPGREFALAPKAMAPTMPGRWTAARLRAAIQTLVDRGFLTRVYEGGRGTRDPHRYVLSTPSTGRVRKPNPI